MVRRYGVLLSLLAAFGLIATTTTTANAANKNAAKTKVKSKATSKAQKKGAALPAYSKSFQKRYKASRGSDPDGDGLSSYYEYLAHTNPRRSDSDRDGVTDDREDRDKDGLVNGIEEQIGTNPARRDTDRNGRSDAQEDRDKDGLNNLNEQRTGNDPRIRDTDDDGILDGDESTGRVVRFDRGTGVISLWLNNERRVVSAVLAEDASILCSSIGGGSDDTVSSQPGDESGNDAGDQGDIADENVDYSDESVDTADDAQSDDSIDDPSIDDPASDDAGDDTGNSAEESVAPDGSMCIDNIKRGAWFSDAELYEDDETGGTVVSLLELYEF